MIWLAGRGGLLGSEVAKALAEAGLEFAGSGREVDIRDPGALAGFAAGKNLDWIVNCAAYTAVDGAEDEADLAFALNAEGPDNLARLAAGLGARILHVSTDYVFDGSGARPYREEDPVAPLGAYGRSKAAGEERVRAACPEHVILRTAWLYGRGGGDFVSALLGLLRSKGRAGVVADQVGSPTYAGDLARAIAAIAGSPAPVFGIFHYANRGEASRYEFALEIKRLGVEYGILPRDCAVEALTAREYPAKARRPAYSALSTDKIREAYGLKIPEWRESLALFLREAHI
jgi:dTDP-4-dehydrorhamnose reductase